ncbi:uncharacterized protein LOC121416628 [Lytechinus variegatus]|uniref:uncharacterized protein LOC121416628 n=1 Tax=Lytechinus variegatus TaxID=7654 RepID=UPI001BB2B7B4|nr:uncharacterized protein LOC121416628 [Lytechinus variegatus]
MTEIPPATATSACPIIPEVKCTECLQNTTLSMPVYGECHDWKLAFSVVLPSLLFLLGLLVLSYIRLKRRSKDSLGPTEINASPCTVATIPAPRNVYVECNDIENSYEEIEQKGLHIQL